MSGYDYFDPNKVGFGDLFAEITPIGFNVRIKEGIPLTQLRLFLGEPEHAEIHGEDINRTCIQGSATNDGLLSVSLEPEHIGGLEGAAFEGITPGRKQYLGSLETFRCLKARTLQIFKFLKAPDKRLRLQLRHSIYFGSKERLSIPGEVAVYILAIDETLGEMRIHYAGFAHPWFGRNRKDDDDGTPIIFEGTWPRRTGGSSR